MSDISDTIQEASEHARESKINGKVAIWVALTATFMALCDVKDGNIVQAMEQAQAHAIDAWSYFQAKSTKEIIVENSVEYLKVQKNGDYEDLIKKHEDQIARYEKEKTEIKKQAEGYQQEYDALNTFDDQFDMTDAFLSIAIAIFWYHRAYAKTVAAIFCCWCELVRNGFGVGCFSQDQPALGLYCENTGIGFCIGPGMVRSRVLKVRNVLLKVFGSYLYQNQSEEASEPNSMRIILDASLKSVRSSRRRQHCKNSLSLRQADGSILSNAIIFINCLVQQICRLKRHIVPNRDFSTFFCR